MPEVLLYQPVYLLDPNDTKKWGQLLYKSPYYNIYIYFKASVEINSASLLNF